MKKNSKTAPIVVGIVAAVAVITGVVITVLALNGVFDGGKVANNNEEKQKCEEDPDKVWVCLDRECGCEYRGAPYEDKPIIYLYPESKTDLVVKLSTPENLTVSYPKYADGWNVTAYPNGDLVDKKTGNKLYSLYWEGRKQSNITDKTTGFVVKGTDSAKFLEEKLDILGLNYREKEEFIVYWIPKLEANAYNYIYFESAEEIEKDMPLELSVQPDTVIRVRMVFEGLTEKKDVKEQVLAPAPARKGFTVVEWGGINLDK
ncbi:hypothetical protein IK110_00500 [Candidatus Saccharibacteria bacterium]|nr:hypothetical protein [Candidatus Saccharibacteria bacterium]